MASISNVSPIHHALMCDAQPVKPMAKKFNYRRVQRNKLLLNTQKPSHQTPSHHAWNAANSMRTQPRVATTPATKIPTSLTLTTGFPDQTLSEKNKKKYKVPRTTPGKTL